MSNSNSSMLPWVLGALAIIVIAVGIAFALRARHPRISAPAFEANRQYPHFVFAKITDAVQPLARGEKYEDTLQATLEEKGIGEVTGGGSQLDKDNRIEWVGIDIDLANLDSALETVRQRLVELGAPKGSVLEFKRDGQNVTLPIHPN